MEAPHSVRPAAPEDIPQLVRMGVAFFEESGYSDVTTLDVGAITKLFRDLIDGQGALLVVESGGKLVGMTAGIVYPFYFNRDHVTGQELFWWVAPEHRANGVGSELLKALEAWAKGRGAQSFAMVALPQLDAEKVGALYRKAGYRPSENTFIRRL